MGTGEMISELMNTKSDYLATYWSEMNGHGPGEIVLDYRYQPESPGSFPHLGLIFLLSIERTPNGYKIALNDRQRIQWAVDDLLKRKGVVKG